jgi:hypothetical protein
MAEPSPVAFYARNLARNIVAGAKLAFFLPLRPHEFRVSHIDYVVLVAFSFVVWVLGAAVRAGFTGEFDTGAIIVYLATVSFVLLTALLLSLAYRAPDRLLLFAVALTSADPAFELIGLGLVFGAPQVAFVVFLAWTWLASVRVVLVCGGRQRPQVYQAVFAVTAMTAAAFVLLPRTDVWLPPLDEDEVAGQSLADERLFHLQGELIERSLAAVQPGRRGVSDVYFVGFAPDASQDVFLNEMRFVRRLFEEKLGAGGRSIALASSHTALEELPIASVTNLARALTRVGEQMNPDEDVLFLYISAHGDPEHRLSASQPPLALAPLTPTSLARMLQDVAVKWRVIVISACYSGGFVEPLRDANTVVITAAAADRTSFGCEAGRDFTYFGEAYFRDALPRAGSFTAAFDLAKDIVEKREQAEKLTPSQPQIWVGAAIAERLKNLAN